MCLLGFDLRRAARLPIALLYSSLCFERSLAVESRSTYRPLGTEDTSVSGPSQPSMTRFRDLAKRHGLYPPPRGTRSVPRAGEALALVAFVAFLFFLVGTPLQVWLGESGLLAAEWFLLFVPALLFAFLGGFDFRHTLSLALPTRRAAFGALLLIAGAMPAVWFVGWLQTFFLPIPWETLEDLEELVTADSAGRLAWLLLLLAVTPALCEEVVFRGVLLAGTRSLDPWRFILLNGALFGMFHVSFQTAIRFLPTASLGIVIAWAVWAHLFDLDRCAHAPRKQRVDHRARVRAEFEGAVFRSRGSSSALARPVGGDCTDTGDPRATVRRCRLRTSNRKRR